MPGSVATMGFPVPKHPVFEIENDGVDFAEGDVLAIFTPSGRRGRFRAGTSLLVAARKLGVDLDSICGGMAICGRCQVTVCEGSYPKYGIESRASHLTGVEATEQSYAEKRGLPAGRRLGCAARLLGDVLIDVPPESQVHKQVIRKRAEARTIEIDPVVKLYYVEVAKPDMDDPAGDYQRLARAIEAQWGIALRNADLQVLKTLQKTLRKGKWKATAAVRQDHDLVGLWPGYHDRVYGIAVDVGSTTVACHLCDLESGEVLASAGAMNPQIRFGEDLMSRVSYVIMNEDGVEEMSSTVRQTIARLAAETAAEAGIASSDIIEATFVGNPIMHHLLLGIDPSELGFAPFALDTDAALTVSASADLDLDLHPGARGYVLPCIAGHVGADSAAVILSETPHEADDLTLIVDIGTNAEIVLGNRYRLLAASSPTGPAFEGAQISCGQRAAAGAIERVRIDRKTLEPRFKVVDCELWSDDEDFAEATRDTGVTGICGSGIIEALAEMYLAGILKSDGIIDGGAAARSPRIQSHGPTFSYLIREGEPEIIIIQNDIRAIQLAKAALYTGARLLMNRLGTRVVDRIVLAGAFGSHIDPKYAMVLGLIPDCDLERVSSAGNAAGTGARIALVNRGARKEIEEVVRRVEKIETATEASFQDLFVAAMPIPHKSDPFPNLAKAVRLPESPMRSMTIQPMPTANVRKVWGRQKQRKQDP